MADNLNDEQRNYMGKVQAEAAKLTEDDVANFLINKCQKLACLSCGSTAWAIFSPAEFGFTMIRAGDHLKRPSDPAMTSIPVVPVFCNNCGYVAQYAAFTIAEWKLAWPPKPKT